MERGSDWFERERPNLDEISTVAAMVNAGPDLVEDFLASLGLGEEAEEVVRGRLQAIAAEPIVLEPKIEL